MQIRDSGNLQILVYFLGLILEIQLDGILTLIFCDFLHPYANLVDQNLLVFAK